MFVYLCCAWCLKSPEDNLEMELQVLVNVNLGSLEKQLFNH